jgi:hypothetical protein
MSQPHFDAVALVDIRWDATWRGEAPMIEIGLPGAGGRTVSGDVGEVWLQRMEVG